ncbi:nuclear transport factor 2 family protein [Sphingomonas canadensis]|uniref:Nuclear transport factor 2 family protein n=1 Tax=Sphingomonas canadensis TaxID=1219257 RepID=A0ABW3H9Q1_9SPHN|nr:nuclear transport factor 2 family protein [Sphingomonas canadensis]MCW3837691.1 nuclear transport factor 2 family protein [Sphingomonas canadensis]
MRVSVTDELIRLNAELSLQLSHYWHEIDTNGGRNASDYYTEDAEFHGQFASYHGRDKIQQFYDWRVAQGPRLAVHAFTNYRAWFTGPDTAEATNYLFLYAENGVKPLPSKVPVTVSLATDKFRRVDGKWLCTYRRFEHLFESDVPITNPTLDGDSK